MAQARKIIDVPLADIAPTAVRERLTSPEFATLLADHNTTRDAWEAATEATTAPADLLAAYDAYKAARHRLEQYKDTTAAMLPAHEVPEADFALPHGAHHIGDAEPGTVTWQKMRQPTLGGSDVGAICKVGEYGQMNYDDVRAAKTAAEPQPQDHTGAALRGDLWEPWVIAMTSQALDLDIRANKGTYTDGQRHVNLDGFTLTPEGTIAQVVEAKTSSHPEDWEGTVPAGYALQTQHYGDFFDAPRPALLAANLNDERLVVWEVPRNHKVPAGKATPKKLGEAFSYTEVRDYAQSMVSKWATGGASTTGSARRSFRDTPEVRATWQAALERGVVLADLETTGFSPERGHIIEVALVRVAHGEEVARFHRFYGVPEDHALWNGTGAEDVHRISVGDVAGLPVLAQSPEEIAAIREFIGDSVLVAHNSSFEDRWLSFHGVSVPCADTMRAFGIAVTDAGIADNTMGSLMQWAGFEYKDAHRAINDVLMMLQALPALLERVRSWVRPALVAA